jgi:hypothetical protein
MSTNENNADAWAFSLPFRPINWFERGRASVSPLVGEVKEEEGLMDG